MTLRIFKLPTALLILLPILSSFSSRAQDWKEDKKVNVLFGLTQPFWVKSFSIEGNYKEVFLNYGAVLNPRYQLNRQNYIGLYAFVPLIQDKAQSGYQFGIGWSKKIN